MDSINVNMNNPYYLRDRELLDDFVKRVDNIGDTSSVYVVVSVGVALRFMHGLNDFFDDTKVEDKNCLNGELKRIGSIFGVDIYVDPLLNFHYNEITFYGYGENSCD